MKIHKFRCNICGCVLGLDQGMFGLTDDLGELVNPRDADIHVCDKCLRNLTEIGTSLYSVEKQNCGG